MSDASVFKNIYYVTAYAYTGKIPEDKLRDHSKYRATMYGDVLFTPVKALLLKEYDLIMVLEKSQDGEYEILDLMIRVPQWYKNLREMPQGRVLWVYSHYPLNFTEEYMTNTMKTLGERSINPQQIAILFAM